MVGENRPPSFWKSARRAALRPLYFHPEKFCFPAQIFPARPRSRPRPRLSVFDYENEDDDEDDLVAASAALRICIISRKAAR